MCSPSRASFITGRYPFRMGMGGARALYYGSKNGLPQSEITLANVLKDLGYRTYLVGKWHLGFGSWNQTPLARGFDYFYGMYGGSITHYTHMSYEGGDTQEEGYDFFEDTWEGDKIKHKVVLDKEETYDELLLTQKAVDIISKYEKDDRFFLLVSYTTPHSPINPLPSDYESNSHITNKNRRKMAGMVTSLDYGVGRIHETLVKRDLLNDTILLFFSDNGAHIMMFDGLSLGGSNYPLRGSKTNFYEGGIKVPAFIHVPGYKVNDTEFVYNGLFHISDWFPTLLGLSELKIKQEHQDKLDGIDHSEVFRSIMYGEYKYKEPRKELILDIDPVYNFTGIIKGNFKLMIGNVAAMGFSDVYGLLKENKTHYEIDTASELNKVNENKKNLDLYMSLPNPCLSVECIPVNQTFLYNLDVDPYESTDISERFVNIKQDLYNRLYNETRHRPISKPGYFEDHNSEARVFDSNIGKNVWRPWIDNSFSISVDD